jgi:hypothetical protein
VPSTSHPHGAQAEYAPSQHRLHAGTSVVDVTRVGIMCARLWRDASDRTWLETPPLIQMQRHPNKRQPYPLSIEEERLLFSELEGHLARMALFKV